ncbi:MAG: peptidase domain-containing ABC transporter [Alphaproteobacteria bacterium]
MVDILQELNFSRQRRLPMIHAAELAECGLASIAMVAAYWGHDVDLNGLRQRFQVSLTGATLRSIMGLADQLDFTTRAIRVELEALHKVKVPAILHWDFNHFVVLKCVEKGRVTIHDPAAGARTLPLGEVSKHFTGVVLELAPAATFAPVKATAPTRLSDLWSRMSGFWSAFAQVLVLSVTLQVLVFAAPFQLQLVVDEAIYRGDYDLLVVLALAFGALALIQALVDFLRGWVMQSFGFLLTFQMVGNLVRHLLRLPASYFERRHVGDILSRIEAAGPIQEALTRGLVGAIIDGAMALVAVIILFFYSPVLAGIVVASVALNILVALALFPALRQRTEERIAASAKEQTHLMESIRAAATIKLSGREAEREGAWRNLFAGVTNAAFSVGKYQLSLTFAQSAINGAQTVLIIFLAARTILAGEGFSVGMLFAFLAFRATFTDRIVGLINQGVQFRLLGLYLERLGDIVQTPPETQGGAILPCAAAGALGVSDVSFRYGAADRLILQNVNLSIAPGDYVAIVGPSGGGKSTLLKLLLGLYAPTEGRIELDGHEATPERWREWRKRVGVVAQDDRLLSGTIADNISFFDPDLDMARIQASARAARVHDDIMALPMQYLSLIGDMGSILSGGQRQRVLLARALYRNPKVLILDEGTANLDEANEEEIADLVSRLAITRIIVAHRPSLVRRATRVYVLEGGVLRQRAANQAPKIVAGE